MGAHNASPLGAVRSGLVLMLAVAVATPLHAHADRYEATIRVRPEGGLARVDETGASSPAVVGGGGVAAGLSWGVRNWLDLGGELAAVALAEARYDGASARVFDVEYQGELWRTTRLAQLRGTATLRLGVGWVPTIQLALGVGGRQRTAARFAYSSAIVMPDGGDAELVLDAVAGLRVGLDHRLTRRWTMGLSAGATACLGIGAPDLQFFDASLSLAYTWYPLW
jgi:hypothetical protein